MEQVRADLSASSELPEPDFDEPYIFDMETLNAALRFCLDNKVEDLILMSGIPWSVMWSSKVIRLGKRPLVTEHLKLLVNNMTGNANAALDLMSQAMPYDIAYTLRLERGRSVRFRVSITSCLGADGYQGIHFVIRPTGKVPPTLIELATPQLIIDNCEPSSGIVIVTGPTGSGKTTLLDAIVRKLATQPDGKHILTYYAPIENDLNTIPNVTGVISQCEIGRAGQGANLTSFSEGVSNALRRHPHAVLIGEARDAPTIEGAVTLAMTGHATYTTSHTSSVAMTIPRMADSFADRVRITNALIDNCRLIIHQRLVKTPSGIGRAPIRSALVFTQELRTSLLRLPNIDNLSDAINEAVRDESIGIDLYKDALRQFEDGKIHEDEMLSIERELGGS